jgi:creatinine amidohydrolase/Fe(II)-dependent formamide hydrolase-like protein
VKWLFVTDQEVAADEGYLHEHAAGGETSLLMAIRPDLVDLDKTFETDKELKLYYAEMPDHLKRRRETEYKYIGVLTAAEDGTNDPETAANVEWGKKLLEIISERIAERAVELLEQS